MSSLSPEGRWSLEPLPYHRKLLEYLQREEAEIWAWFSSDRERRAEKEEEAVRFELLKSTYRIGRNEQPGWYEIAHEAALRLELSQPITLYQAHSDSMNASIAFLNDEAHIVLAGPIATKFTEEELLGLFAHELSHLLLRTCWNHDYFLVDEVIGSLVSDRDAVSSHYATARLLRLYTEIFCDRGALAVVGDPIPVISGFIKIITGLDKVDVENYRRQAEEIFANRSSKSSEGWTHPEDFIRTKAIDLWHECGPEADAKIAAMIEGPLSLPSLDLLGQERASSLTRRLIDALLTPVWMQTETMLGHARLFFNDFEVPPPDIHDRELAANIAETDRKLIEYFCYLLLDFATTDLSLEEAPLAAALSLAESLGIKEVFSELACKELKLSKRQFEKLDASKETLLQNAAKELTQS